MSTERLIIQNIARSKIKESLCGEVSYGTSQTREIMDLLETLNLMIAKGYNTYVEETFEKRAYRAIEAKLTELGVSLDKEPVNSSEGLPGSFESDKNLGKVSKF